MFKIFKQKDVLHLVYGSLNILAYNKYKRPFLKKPKAFYNFNVEIFKAGNVYKHNAERAQVQVHLNTLQSTKV